MQFNHFTISIAFFIASIVLILIGCTSKADRKAFFTTGNSPKGNIHYFSLNKAIHNGQYDGFIEIGKLKKYGNFGLGSFEKLSHEFVMKDGIAYGIPEDGKVYTMPDTALIAFAVTTDFKPDTSFKITESLKKAALYTYLNTVLKKNNFAAIEINGHFSHIKYRSFPPQSKPYKPSEEVPNVIFERENIDIDMIGYFTPLSAEVLNSPVYHFHFIDKNRTTGGHVLDFNIEKAEIKIAYSKEHTVHLPPDSIYSGINLNEK